MSGATGKLNHRKVNTAILKKQRRGGYQPKAPGDLVQIDTVVKFIHGIKRYCVTAVDVTGRFAFAYGYKSPSSANAADFLAKVQTVAPFEIRRVQTDNGSEFYRHFHQACEDQGLTHFWNYPRSPKMNARVERFNRTIQEEFIDTALDTLATDLDEFNQLLIDWLLWYNTERPHFSLGQVSPMRYLVTNFGLSRMIWTHTYA
jgi:transposase InsO family protein